MRRLPERGTKTMKYAVRRVAMLLITMVIVSLLAFVAFDLISGDAATAMMRTRPL